MHRCPVLATRRELVRIIIDDVCTVEDAEDADDEATVPFISDTPTVVTLTRQVSQSLQWRLIVIVDEHLGRITSSIKLCIFHIIVSRAQIPKCDLGKAQCHPVILILSPPYQQLAKIPARVDSPALNTGFILLGPCVFFWGGETNLSKTMQN